MKTKVLFLLILACMLNLTVYAQRGVRIGYIDTEYILENVPEYLEASKQLENKVQKWKEEIESRLNNIEQKKKALSNESALLTKELISEREEDIHFEEAEVLDYQQKRFGPNGDLIIQKRQLIQPIQDQIFLAVQDIAKNKKFDFVFDKSADVVMLYSAERFDISDLVLRSINRTSKRTQAQSKKEKRDAENEDVVPVVNKKLEEKQKAVEESQAQKKADAEARRQQILAEREAKKKEIQEKREKVLAEREEARQKKLNERKSTKTNKNEEENEEEKKTSEQITEEREKARQEKLKEREERKKALEEKRKKTLEEREKARQEKLKEREEKKKKSEEEQNNN